mgnify:CR=1 FL=1
MVRLGMDVEVVDSVAAELDRHANALDRVRGEVGRQVSSAHGRGLWTGGNADRYVADWRGSDARVRDLVRAVHDFARHLREQARQQRDASRASGGASSSGGSSSLTPDPRPMAPKFPPSVHDYRDLAGAAYIGGSVPSPYQEVTGDELRRMGLRPSDLDDPGSGFHATVLRDPSGNYVVSFRGSEDLFKLGNSPDRNEDAIGTVALTRQGELAGLLALNVKNFAGADHVAFTGHSLGGRLASVASLATGAPAVTFNAAGLGDEEAMYAMVASGKDVSLFDYVGRGFGLGSIAQQMTDAERSGQITNYRTTLDPLTALQQSLPVPKAAGHQTTVPGTGFHDLSDFGDLTDY